jgi:2EXR family
MELPPEIRRMIWSFTRTPRMVGLEASHPADTIPLQKPVILDICHESRIYGLSVYEKWAIAGNQFICFDIDTIVLGESYNDVIEQLSDSDMDKVKHLGFYFKSERGDDTCAMALITCYEFPNLYTLLYLPIDKEELEPSYQAGIVEEYNNHSLQTFATTITFENALLGKYHIVYIPPGPGWTQ